MNNIVKRLFLFLVSPTLIIVSYNSTGLL